LRHKWDYHWYACHGLCPGPPGYPPELPGCRCYEQTASNIPYIQEQVDSEGRVTLSKSRKYLERQADAFLKFVQKRIECASCGK
jgi:hypothetical protein